MKSIELPEEVVITVDPTKSNRKPLIADFIEKPEFPDQKGRNGLTIKASRVTHIRTTGANKALDYDMDD